MLPPCNFAVGFEAAAHNRGARKIRFRIIPVALYRIGRQKATGMCDCFGSLDSASACQQTNDEDRQEDEKQYLSDAGRRRSDSSESEDRGDDRDNQKDPCVTEHLDSPHLLSGNFRASV